MNPLERAFAKLREAVGDVPLRDVKRSKFGATLESPGARIGAGDLKLAAGATTALALTVLNEPRDEDEDRVFAAENGHITYSEQKAWLKYKITGTLQAGAAAKGLLAAAAEAKKQISLSDYRAHEASMNALSALDDDRRHFRSILEKEEVRALRPGEALALQSGGELTATVSFSWADALSTALSELTSLVPSGAPVTVKFTSGVNVSVKVSVEDELTVVMSRTPDGRLRIAVRKAAARGRSVKLKAGLTATIDAASPIVAVAWEAVLGTSAKAVESLLEKLDGTFFDAGETELIEFLARRFKLDTAAHRNAALKKHLGKLKAEVVKRLERIATRKAEIGFAYEYSRIDSDKAIADYLLTDAGALDADYDDAVTGDFAAITRRLAEPGPRILLSYLNEKSIVQKESFGFSLGFGKWAVKFVDGSTLEYRQRLNLQGEALITCKGARTYDEPRLPDNDFVWSVDLKADMRRYEGAPSTSDFDFGLHYLVTFRRASLNAPDIRRLADFAATWQIADREAAEQALAPLIGKEATVRFQLMLDHDALAQTLSGVPKSDRPHWAAALAAAMPWVAGLDEREHVERRTAAYAPLWSLWLQSDDAGIADWRSAIRRAVNPPFDQQLNQPMSFLWMVKTGYPQLRGRLDDFIDGLRLLEKLMTSERDPREIRRAYELLQRAWTQRPYITATGCYLLDRAARAGAVVEKTLLAEAEGAEVVLGRLATAEPSAGW